MNFFDKIYSQIFSKKAAPEYGGRKYLVQESYGLSEMDNSEYLSWKNHEEAVSLVQQIFQGINHKKAGLSESNQRYSVYESPQSNGFYVLCEEFMSSKQSVFLLEHLKDGVAGLSYYLNHSSKDIYEEKGNVKTRLSYYLKPKLSNFELPLDQKFGNIHIELMMINDNPDYIKLMANVYSDRNYQQAQTFDDLLKELSIT